MAAGSWLERYERNVLNAFAEALVGERLDLDAIAGILERASPRVRTGIRLAVVAFDRGTYWTRFSKKSLPKRRAHLERIADRSSGPSYEIFSVLKSLVLLAHGNDPKLQQRVGVRVGCETAGEDPSPERLDPAAMRVEAGGESCDVVVVGSGAGGAAAARLLSEAGLSVIVVEEGSYHDARTYSSDTFETTANLYRDGGLTVCEGRPAIPMPLGRCVGGTTVFNSGTCFHTPQDVLADWRDRHGVGWATALDSDFEQLDRDLAVEPVDPATAGRNAELCRGGADAIGASNGPIKRNAGDVVCCSSCPNGCRLDAKRAMHVSELPKAVAAGARIRAGARVEGISFQGTKATGIHARTASGRYEVRARAVVLAAGAIGTPKLMLAQGIADLSGQIGRNLRIHPACWVGARYDEEVRGWDGVMQSWYVDEWRDRGLFLEATFTPFAFGLHWLPGSGEELQRRISDYGRMAIIGVHMSDRRSSGLVAPTRSGHARISYRLDQADAEQIRFGIARAAEIHLAAGAREVFPQIAGIGPIRTRADLQALEAASIRPSDLRLEAFHPMGTVRMGAERSTSVLAPTGESHELQELFVADASIFPTSLKVNPMITIMACARQIARGLADRLC